MKELIYLDHAAATPVSEAALLAMERYCREEFFNPSAPYLPAVEVRRAYEGAKEDLGRVIGAKGSEIVMTAGATESINLAFTVASSTESQNTMVLVSEIEHAAVMGAAQKVGGFQMIRVNRNGIIDLDDLKRKITGETRLVSVALVNGELGTIQPLAEISVIIEEERMRRLKEGSEVPIYLHSDASQGLGLIDVNVGRLGVDMLSLNAGKVYGPKQVGLLYVASGVRLMPVVAGGGQELGLRSGTENVAGAIGFAVAAKEAVSKMASERKRLEGLRRVLREKLEGGISDVKFIGAEKKQLVSFLPIVVAGVDAERLIFALEKKGVLVSSGAACSANKGKKSHVLVAIGLSDEEIGGSLRITLGKLNDEGSVARAAELIVEAVKNEKERVKNA